MFWFKQQRAERLSAIRRPSRKPKKRKTSTQPRLPSRWEWEGHQTVEFTKSEARARFKQKLRLKRLPIGAVVTKTNA